MAVQFADKALEQWLTAKICGLIKTNPHDDQTEGQRRFYYTEGYADALKDTIAQLHELWGAQQLVINKHDDRLHEKGPFKVALPPAQVDGVVIVDNNTDELIHVYPALAVVE